MMADVAGQFPAKTAGHGGDRLEPKVLADGTKEFDLEAKIVKWEVAPGKIVDAWTYNGVVPAPEIHVNDGDKVRIVLTNNLPESTSLHLHGVRVPNAMDGVDPYTQPPIPPGESFTYEFVAKGPAVGIYHSHHNAQMQVPNGLFGAFTIDEMPIPQVLIDKGYTKVDKSMNMVLNDAGTIGLSLNGKSFPATEPTTMRVGEVLEVNYLNEGLMAHPMHLHQPVGWIIAKDGVPLDQPLPERHDQRRPRRALHRAVQGRGARRVGLALPHPQPRRGPDGHVRNGHRADRGAVSTTAVLTLVRTTLVMLGESRSRNPREGSWLTILQMAGGQRTHPSDTLLRAGVLSLADRITHQAAALDRDVIDDGQWVAAALADTGIFSNAGIVTRPPADWSWAAPALAALAPSRRAEAVAVTVPDARSSRRGAPAPRPSTVHGSSGGRGSTAADT